MTVLDGFKLKSFDLEPIYASWPDAPKFVGNPKKDPNVDDWLQRIKAGCVERNVPREYWHKVAQHYMGEKAKARLNELKFVMAKVHGGTYRWNWDKFKIAMRNMGWNVDPNETKEIRVTTNRWWLPQKKQTESPVEEGKDPLPVKPTASTASASSASSTRPQALTRSSSFWLTRKTSADKSQDKEIPPVPPVPPVPQKENKRPTPSRAATVMSDILHLTKKDSDYKEERPSAQKTKSETAVSTVTATPTKTRAPKPSKTMPPPPIDTVDETITTVTHAPVWLLNACNALDFLQGEHPKVMSTLSAILITAGSIPAIPAISAGAGGALLASGAAQAVGAIAVGVGSWLKSQQDMSQGSQTGQEKSG